MRPNELVYDWSLGPLFLVIDTSVYQKCTVYVTSIGQLDRKEKREMESLENDRVK